jgi:hypothetical protein
MSDFIKKLIKVQSTLNAPKNQYNSFGKYNYRSCEDIMGALKPLLSAEGLFQSIDDEVIQVGDRFYIKATVTVTDGKDSKSCSAMARESLTKKGMDDAQVTGATSSYARKYALNGMYNIDDSKDADTNEFRQQATTKAKQSVKSNAIDFDGLLKKFTSNASSANEKMLKTLFGQAWKELATSKEHQAKAKEVYDIRLSELTTPEA